MKRLPFLLLFSLLLSACQSGDPPAQSWENAVVGLYSAALSADSRFAVIGSINHGGSLWRVQDGERLYDWNHREGEMSTIIAAGFSPEGEFALTADHQTLVLWSTQSGKPLTFWSAPHEVLSVDLTPRGRYALLGLGDFTAVLFDVQRGGIQRRFHHQDRVRSVALSADGKLAVTGAEDDQAKLWEVQSGQTLFTWPHAAEVVTVAIAPAGNRALTVAKYDKAVIWDTASGQAIWELPLRASALKRGVAFSSARFSNDGALLLTGSTDQQVQLWDVEARHRLQQWTLPKRHPWKPTGAAVLALSFGKEKGRYYAVGSNGFTHRLQRRQP